MAGDWRDKVKAAKKEEKRAAKKAAKSGHKSAAGVDMEALSAKLPSGWTAMRDPSSGEVSQHSQPLASLRGPLRLAF